MISPLADQDFLALQHPELLHPLVRPRLRLGLRHDEIVALAALADDPFEGDIGDLSKADFFHESTRPLYPAQKPRDRQTVEEVKELPGPENALLIGIDIEERQLLRVARLMQPREALLAPELHEDRDLVPPLVAGHFLDPAGQGLLKERGRPAELLELLARASGDRGIEFHLFILW